MQHYTAIRLLYHLYNPWNMSGAILPNATERTFCCAGWTAWNGVWRIESHIPRRLQIRTWPRGLCGFSWHFPVLLPSAGIWRRCIRKKSSGYC